MADIDVADAAAEGTGIAVLIGVELGADNTAPMYQTLRETAARPSPIAACHALQESIEADFPHHTFAVVANIRAKYLQWTHVMRHLGIASDLTPAAYVRAAQADG